MMTNGEVLRTMRLDTLNKINQGNTRTLSIPVDFSTEEHPNFKGVVVVKHPSQMETIRIGQVRAQLLGGLPVDTHTDNIAYIIATLDTITVEAPEWFNAYSPDIDYDMLEYVFIEYSNWVESFRKGSRGEQHISDSESRES